MTTDRTRPTDFDRLASAWLADGPTELVDRVLDAALREVHSTKQRRASRVPWRFPYMPALTRATGIAAVALVAAVGVGGLMYVNSSGPGGQATASPTPTTMPTTAAPTTKPTVAATQCPQVAPGICGWKTYTSAVYGYTISYPDDWSVVDRATQIWQPGASEGDPFEDIFYNNAPQGGVVDDSMIFLALQIPAPAGAELSSWDGLLAALTEMCAKPAEFYLDPCPSEFQVTRLCMGSAGCQPVAFLHDTGERPRALFGDLETGRVTYIHVGRDDDFRGAARYGGTNALLKSILSQMGVREPLPGETPN